MVIMTTIFDVPINPLIGEVAKDLKTKLKQPEWSKMVKTGAHAERIPDNPDWWWVRAASVLIKTYIQGPVGVERLRVAYGGKKRRGVKPSEFRKAGGKVIRVILQDLDKLGFTQPDKGKRGRVIMPKGRSFLDKIASRIDQNVGS